VRRNTKPITIKDSECISGGSAANDVELTLRDLVAVREDWMSREANRTFHQKSAEGKKQRKEESDCESPNGIRKDLMAGKIGHKSHDQKAAEKTVKTDLHWKEAR
jgi:hypothetical protein